MHLILTGATGLVGSAVLHHMIVTPSITTVSVLSRRPVPQAEGHKKVKVIIHKDFNSYPSDVLAQLKDADGCVWAQGISATQVSKEEYENITISYPLSFARAITTACSPKPFNFVYVSGEGATTTPGHFTAFYGVIKGRAEASLLALTKEKEYANLRPYSLRPAAVDPTMHKEILEFLPERKGIMRFVSMQGMLGSVLRNTYAPMVSPTRDLARVLTELAAGDGKALEGKGVDGEGRTISNVGMRRLGGLDC